MQMSKDSFDELIKEEQRLAEERKNRIPEPPEPSHPQPYSGVDMSAVSIIAGFAIVGFFIAMVVGMVKFSKTNPPLCVSCLGLLILVFGIVAVLSTKITWDSWPVIIFPTVGALLTALPIIDMQVKKNTGETFFTDRNILAMISAAFFIAGILMLVMPFVKRHFLLKVCTLPIMATCIDLDLRLSSNRRSRSHVYAPKWKYTVNGKEYEHQENSYTNMNVPKIGSEYEILVNPYDPDQIYRNDPSSMKFMVIFGIIFMLAGIAIFTLGVVMK